MNDPLIEHTINAFASHDAQSIINAHGVGPTQQNSPRLNLRRHGQESLFDIRGVLGARLQERNFEVIRKLLNRLAKEHTKVNLRRCEVHHFLCRQIRLVSNKELVHILTRVPINFLEPLLHVVERLLTCVKITPGM